MKNRGRIGREIEGGSMSRGKFSRVDGFFSFFKRQFSNTFVLQCGILIKREWRAEEKNARTSSDRYYCNETGRTREEKTKRK